MTPRERVETKPSAKALEASENYWRNGNPTDIKISLALTLDAFAVEHIRALLADDEATIEIMARALVIRTAEHYGDPLPPIDLDLSLTKLLARAVLAALRRKALGELA